MEARHAPVRCLLLLALPCALAATACRDDAPRVPTRLANGSPARASPISLETVDGATVATEVDSFRLGRVAHESALARCLERFTTDAPIADVVVRTGVAGESVTVGTTSGRALYACDGRSVRGARTGWCGTAYGRLERGRLRDPRLDLTECSDGAGRPVAFAWIEPRRNTRFVALRQPGYVEVYPVTRGLPVRIATATGIDVESSHASFELSEHDARGRLLRAYDLETGVAG